LAFLSSSVDFFSSSVETVEDEGESLAGRDDIAGELIFGPDNNRFNSCC